MLYQDSLALDPDFELEEPRCVSQLVALAMHEQQPQLAISLAREFLRRFPDESGRLPPVPQVLVRTIPESGRKSLYLASHIGRIFEVPEEEGRALVAELIAHTTQRQFVYTHRWRPRDLVMWDNRCTMHRGTDYDDLRWVRDMRRTTVSDVANSCEQAGVAVPA